MSQLPRRASQAERLFAYLSEHGSATPEDIHCACRMGNISNAAASANLMLERAGDPRRIVHTGHRLDVRWQIVQQAAA